MLYRNTGRVHTSCTHFNWIFELMSSLRSNYALYHDTMPLNTTATKPCTLSAGSAPAVRLHGLSPHICDTSTRCCNHMVTSNPERDVFTTTVLHTRPNALILLTQSCISRASQLMSCNYSVCVCVCVCACLYTLDWFSIAPNTISNTSLPYPIK